MPRKSYIRMAFDAITNTKHARKGVSRQAIANYIKQNFDDVSDGAHFTTALRNALKSGISRGVLVHGISNQRFKLTQKGNKENKQCNSRKYPTDKKGKKKKIVRSTCIEKVNI
eukprot:101114_1